MATSTLISDYIGRGTHAARPASPNVASGCAALYYETDTTNTFAWNGAAWVQINAPAGASIVQVAAVAGTTGSVTMPSTPTSGNLLIAVVMDFGSSLLSGTGWTSLFSTSGGGDGYGYGFKIAGASESKTQTPTNDATTGIVVVWEIAGGAFGIPFVTKDLASATPSQTFQTFKANQLCIGVVDREAATIVPTSTSGMDHSTNVVGGSRSLTYFDVTPASAGSHVASATYSGSATDNIIVIPVG